MPRCGVGAGFYTHYRSSTVEHKTFLVGYLPQSPRVSRGKPPLYPQDTVLGPCGGSLCSEGYYCNPRAKLRRQLTALERPRGGLGAAWRHLWPQIASPSRGVPVGTGNSRPAGGTLHTRPPGGRRRTVAGQVSSH